ncbi:MAG: tetratricopeptide repeat protein [Granulosicoccus sp.]
MTNPSRQLATDMVIGGVTSWMDLVAAPVGGLLSPVLQALFGRTNAEENPMNVSEFINALDHTLKTHIERSDGEFFSNRIDVSSAAQTVACDLLHDTAFDSKAFLTAHGEDSEKATTSLLEERPQFLPYPCEEVLMVRIRLLVRAWFDAMSSQPIVLSDIAKHFRQEVLKGQTEQRERTDALQESVSDLRDDIPEYFETQKAEHEETRSLISAELSDLRSFLTEQRTAVQSAGLETKATDDENTALHGQLTQIAHNIEKGDIKNSIEHLESLRTSDWSSATPSEKRRLLAVTANAYFAKSDTESVQRFIRDAIVECPTHKRVTEDRALLSLLGGEYRGAEELALKALEQDPTSLNAACILISSRREPTSVDLLESVPEELLQNPRIQGTALWVMWGREESGWETKAIEAWHDRSPAHDNLYPLDQVYALAVIELASKTDMSVAFGSTIEHVSREDLDQASKILMKNAEQALSCESQTLPESVNNAVTSLRLLGNDEATNTAKALLDKSLELRTDVEALFLHRSVLSLIDGDFQWVAETIPDDTVNSELLTHRVQSLIRLSRLPEAASTIKRIVCDPDDFMAHCFLLDLSFQIAMGLSDSDAIDSVFAEIDSLIENYPSELRYQLLKCRLYREKDKDEEAIACLLSLIPLYKAETDFSIRMQGAIEAEIFGRHDLVVRLLWGRVAQEIDSQPLQMLIVALLNNHDYALAKELIEGLSEDLAEQPFYLKSVARLSMRVGDPHTLLDAEAYLNKVPNDAEVLTYKIHRVQVEGDEVDVRNALNGIDLNALDGPILNRMRLSAAAVHYGNVRGGFDALFLLLLTNWNDHRVHQTFQVLAYTNPDVSNCFSAANKVEHMSSVTLRDANNNEKDYVLWDSPPPMLQADCVRQDSELGQLLLGKSIGEKITIGAGFGQTDSTVVMINSVYLTVLRRSEADFRTRFPTVEGNVSVSVDTNEEGLGEDIINIIRAQSEGTARALKLYQTNKYPLVLLAQALSTDVLETRMALIQHGIPFPSSTGMGGERQAALRAIRANNVQGCVCDLLTAVLIHRLDIWQEVVQICGQIYLSSRDVDTLSLRKLELGRFGDGPRMSISYSNGSLVRHELSEQEVHDVCQQRQLEFDFIAGACSQSSAMPTTSMSVRLQFLQELKDDQMFDPIIISDSKQLLLVSEDLAYRSYAASLGKTENTWLQPILDFAKAEGVISKRKYAKTIANIACSNTKFLVIDSLCLIDHLSDNDYQVTPLFSSLLETLMDDENLPNYVSSVLSTFLKMLSRRSISRSRELRIASEILAIRIPKGTQNPLRVMAQFLDLISASNHVRRHSADWFRWRFMRFDV